MKAADLNHSAFSAHEPKHYETRAPDLSGQARRTISSGGSCAVVAQHLPSTHSAANSTLGA